MHLANLYRYPLKGLTPEPLQRASLAVGETLPFDRAWALRRERAAPLAQDQLPDADAGRAAGHATDEIRRRDRDADHPARRQTGGPRAADHPARSAAHRAVHWRLHEVGTARAPEDRARPG